MNPEQDIYDVCVIGGGPSGATAAHELARKGRRVLLLDRAGRIKPCGGAIPPRLIKDFDIPPELIVAKARCARMVAPTGRHVDIPIENGYVGMVDRGDFDEWLRVRAADAGAHRAVGVFERIEREADGVCCIHFRQPQRRVRELHDAPLSAAHGTAESASGASGGQDSMQSVRARLVIGADGARSQVAKQEVPGADRVPHVFAYHEIVRSPAAVNASAEASRCDVVYDGRLSPDFYGWVFPHGNTMSIGAGSADRGFSLRQAVQTLRRDSGLGDVETLRREGAPIPMKPMRRWDNGRDVVLAGDAAGVVAPASGEGIYYAMVGGQLAAHAAHECLRTNSARALRLARRQFMREHGRVFWVLGLMQRFWYSSDKRRERFVSICEDKDVQTLTFDAYMNKKLVRAKPAAHARIFFKDLAHLLGLARV